MQKRRRRWVIGLAVTALVAFCWSLVAAWLVVQAGSHASAGLDDVEVVRREASPEALLEPSVAESLERAANEFDDARAAVRNPVLAPLRLVPIVGTQVDGARTLTAAASDAASTARQAVDRLQVLAAEPPGPGPDRVEALQELAEVTETAYRELQAIDVGSGDHLVGPLSNARNRIIDARQKAVEGLRKARVGTAAAARLFAGPRRYLLVAANNAEMRAGSGMFLSAGELEVADGRMRLGTVEPTADLVLPEGTVPVGGDLKQNWGWLDPANDFRNLALTADFPTSADLATTMWPHTPDGRDVDGVIMIDVRGLAGLLRVLGPVEVDGTVYSADTIEQQLLRDQYAEFDDPAARRDRLGEVATAVFDRLERSEWAVGELSDEIWRAVVLRHLIVWSEDPKDAEAWRLAGADGSLDERSLAVSVINRGANKLDQFLATTTTVSTRRLADGRTAVTLAIQLDNQTPDGEPTYIAGPNGQGKVANRYDGVVSVNVPGAATEVSLDGGVDRTLDGTDGPTWVVGALVRVPQGASETIDVSFVLPAGLDRLQLIPSARIPPMTWTIDGEAVDDHRQIVTLSR